MDFYFCKGENGSAREQPILRGRQVRAAQVQMLYGDVGDDRSIKDSKNKIKNVLGKVLNHPV